MYTFLILNNNNNFCGKNINKKKAFIKARLHVRCTEIQIKFSARTTAVYTMSVYLPFLMIRSKNAITLKNSDWRRGGCFF